MLGLVAYSDSSSSSSSSSDSDSSGERRGAKRRKGDGGGAGGGDGARLPSVDELFSTVNTTILHDHTKKLAEVAVATSVLKPKWSTDGSEAPVVRPETVTVVRSSLRVLMLSELCVVCCVLCAVCCRSHRHCRAALFSMSRVNVQTEAARAGGPSAHAAEVTRGARAPATGAAAASGGAAKPALKGTPMVPGGAKDKVAKDKEKEKEKLSLKERTKMKRLKGQTGLDHREWKSETEMQLRQTYD
jgi:hypothetical protein